MREDEIGQMDRKTAKQRLARTAFQSSCAAVALIAASGIALPAHAQRAGMIVENAPHMRPGMIVQNIPHAPPATMIAENIPHIPPGMMIVENIPHVPPATMIAENIPASHCPPHSFRQRPSLRRQPLLHREPRHLFLDREQSIKPRHWTRLPSIRPKRSSIGRCSTLVSAAEDITFLAENTTLFFNGLTDHTVLNRVVPTDPSRAIRFDGRVLSNDNVWFYSPGGIVIGGRGSFDVGSLVLTTHDIDTSGGLFGPDGEIRFRGTSGSSSSIVIEDRPNATDSIEATNDGSYVALVASRIENFGRVDVNGSVAYVAAEQADITINSGLFDINVTAGTTDPNGVVHGAGGRTEGAARNPTDEFVDDDGSIIPANPDAQTIYLVAVPKNDAITMPGWRTDRISARC